MNQTHKRRVNAAKLKNLRLNALMTQQDLSRASGVSRPTIHKYETGADETPRTSCIKKLAKALNVDPHDLVTITIEE